MESQDEQTLSDALESAYDSVESGEAAPEEEVLEIDAPEDAELPEAEAESTEAEPEAEPVETEAEDPDPDDRAPSSWKADVAEKWADVPAEVKAEIQRRESDYHKGIEQYKQYANVGHQVERTIAPFAENLRRAGVEPMQAIEKLLTVEHHLRNGSPEVKAQVVGEILRDYGIDLATVQPPAPIDPSVLALQQQNQQLQRFQQSVIEQQNQAAMSEVEQFGADPQNAHFEAVKEDMAFLLQSNKASTLKEAYDQAVWMRPDIRKSLVEQQRTEAEKIAANQAREKRAKAAAVGVKGSGISKGGSLNPDASLRDTLKAALSGDM